MTEDQLELIEIIRTTINLQLDAFKDELTGPGRETVIADALAAAEKVAGTVVAVANAAAEKVAAAAADAAETILKTSHEKEVAERIARETYTATFAAAGVASEKAREEAAKAINELKAQLSRLLTIHAKRRDGSEPVKPATKKAVAAAEGAVVAAEEAVVAAEEAIVEGAVAAGDAMVAAGAAVTAAKNAVIDDVGGKDQL